MARNELFFVYLLHLVVLVLGMVGFTVLSTDPEYAEKMMKLEEVSTISMEVMVYAACPVAFLLGVLSQLVFRQYFDPWKLVRSRIEPGCCPGSFQDCKPKPISRVVQRTVQGSNVCSELLMKPRNSRRRRPRNSRRENPRNFSGGKLRKSRGGSSWSRSSGCRAWRNFSAYQRKTQQLIV